MTLEGAFADFTRRDWERDPPDDTVRLAVVGTGGFARNRALPAIADGNHCETTALVTESPDRVRSLAAQFDVNHVVDYDGFLAGNHTAVYDAVYVATPNATHGEYAVAAAEHGKHVICEKPLDASLERAREVVDACEDAGVTLMTAYRLQVEPTVRRTRELVRDGVVSDVVQIHGGFSHPLLEDADPDAWQLDPDLAGGGALIDPLNTVRYVLDDDPAGVYASTHSSGPPFDAVDEHVAFQLEFENGATAACTASFDAHASSRLELIGSDGMIRIKSPFGGVVPQEMVVESGDVRMEYTGPPVDEVREEFDYFGYCVLTGTDPEPDVEDGLADLRAIEAAYESAETACRVDLE
ncbi:D-xylose 1-dehydrogenase Gfo6 [Natronolimnohabitans innermongolicus]|uniref:Oxidoreductase domain-containing protein n=1 Tax=Natronolimnohabitans innermongolicus JCM 12255 TaxID=1227499 RepID=L9XC03_9EURY|nr:D-xylose 1-dehydrogenase Gfo6 [Natronolimnohabitans innermongolicus]ELY58961.1 oxidoreductase domain-containing protein [Natronolimnohabitans innermongolicus JCM 12255]